jgi:hypothetical protein
VRYCYNLLGLRRFTIEGDQPIPAGTHQVRMEFSYDGGGLAKGGNVDLFVDGTKVGQGRVEATIPLVFSADETADIGRDTASPLSDDYSGGSSIFTGRVNWVQIDLGDDAEDADHLITPDERLKVAMARRSRQPNPGMPWVRPSRAEVEPRSRQRAADASITPADHSERRDGPKQSPAPCDRPVTDTGSGVGHCPRSASRASLAARSTCCCERTEAAR